MAIPHLITFGFSTGHNDHKIPTFGLGGPPTAARTAGVSTKVNPVTVSKPVGKTTASARPSSTIITGGLTGGL